MTQQGLSRRTFLQKVALLGLAMGAGSALSGCRDNAGGPTAVAGDCTDVSALTEEQKATRTALQYVSVSEKPGQTCSVCRQFYPASTAGGCGACALVPGPIATGGWCLSWAQRS